MMEVVNTYYKDEKTLRDFILDEHIKNDVSLLIQVFSTFNEYDQIFELLSVLERCLPDAVIIGASTDGEIMNGKISSGKTVLNFTQFEKTTLKVAAVAHKNNGYFSGKYLAKTVVNKNTKLLLAFADGLHTNGEEFLNGINAVSDSVVVAGGHAGDNFAFKRTYVFTKGTILEKGAVAVSLNSTVLQVNTQYSFHWHTIGNEMTITKAEGNRIYTINGEKAQSVYAYYLGQDIADGLPAVGIEFPLITKRNGIDIARTTMSKEEDGSLIMAGSLYEGEKVRIGFGNSNEIINSSLGIGKKIVSKPSEGIYIYSCTARKNFMGHEIEREILPLNRIAPVSGFFTYGEFFTSSKKELLNQTMTIVSLSESESKNESQIEEKKVSPSSNMNFSSINALTHLINVTSKEVKQSNIENKILKERMELALLGSKTSVLDWNFTDNSFYISPSWKKMLGYRDNELPNSISSWSRRVHRDDKKQILGLLKEYKKVPRDYFESTHRIKHKDGHWVWVLGRAQIIYGENGKKIRMIGTHTDITKEKKLQIKILEQKEVLHYQAHHDVLTELPNRISFSEKLAKCIKKSKKHNSGFALFFIDLDKFKDINDSLGHEVGDRVLKLISNRLKMIIRKDDDTLARLSGDEFTIIMGNVMEEKIASVMAEKILSVLEEPIRIDGDILYVSGSIGITLYPVHASNAEYLLKYADTAMYNAKEAGRNTYKFYRTEMTETALEHMYMKTALKQAISNEEFFIHYQPQKETLTNTLVGVEALIRWKHPEKGVLSPSMFITLAEETGLIVEMDRWMMKNAMKQVSSWYKEGLFPGTLALNLSIKQLERSDFIADLKVHMKTFDFHPEWLELEITEGQMMKKPEDAILKLKEINGLGIGISIDDFGTGYSSLSLLKRLPINRLKIDRSFINDILNDPDDMAIVQAIIALAKSLKLDLIAEGVETVAQRDLLIARDCTTMQGHYFSPPVSAEILRKKFL